MSTVLPKVSALSNRVVRILGCNPGRMTLQGTNTYIIGTGQKRVLLDTGESGVPEYIDLLKSFLKENQCFLQSIIVSHWHHDHVGGIPDILKEINPGCDILKLPRASGVGAASEFQDVKFSYISDGDVISSEGATLRVVSTPGHTDDHLVLLLEEENSLFSGDCILGEGTAVFEDLFTYMKSLNKILSLNPSVIYPGHGPTVSDPVPKVKEYIKHRQQREDQILSTLKSYPEGLTPVELVKLIYVTPEVPGPSFLLTVQMMTMGGIVTESTFAGHTVAFIDFIQQAGMNLRNAKDTPENLHAAAAFNVMNHLSKLLKENLIGKTTTGDVEKYKML